MLFRISILSLGGMGKKEKLLRKILSGTADNNIEFSELLNLLDRLGFKVGLMEVITSSSKKM